jgi:hypothetical protein
VRRLGIAGLLLVAGCGGESAPPLDDSATQRARHHVAAIYSGACAPDVCERHQIRPWMRWRVQAARIVDGCEPAWPEVDAPGGDCVEVMVGGAGCGPDESSRGTPVRQTYLRAVRVWLEQDGARWKPVTDAWQIVGGSVAEAC